MIIFNTKKRKAAAAKKIVERIHNDFDGAAQRILDHAKKILAGSGPSEDRVNKLIAAGFTKASDVRERDALIEGKAEAARNAKLVEGYQQKYPFNKFITEVAVGDICNKYGLLLGDAHTYIGTIPDKNLEEIANFKLLASECKRMECGWYRRECGTGSFVNESEENKSAFSEWGYVVAMEADRWHPYKLVRAPETTTEVYVNTSAFKICAPQKDFDMRGKRIDGYKLIDDPIVLQPVYGGYLIVTKWGLEASDKTLLNEKMN